MTDYLQCW